MDKAFSIFQIKNIKNILPLILNVNKFRAELTSDYEKLLETELGY